MLRIFEVYIVLQVDWCGLATPPPPAMGPNGKKGRGVFDPGGGGRYLATLLPTVFKNDVCRGRPPLAAACSLCLSSVCLQSGTMAWSTTPSLPHLVGELATLRPTGLSVACCATPVSGPRPRGSIWWCPSTYDGVLTGCDRLDWR